MTLLRTYWMILLTALWTLIPGVPVFTTQTPAPEKAKTLTPETKVQTLETFLKEFQANYVFPETAEKAAAALRARMQAKEYDAVTDGAEFARMLTDHLREVCHDAHLHLRYSAEPLPERARADRPGPEEEKRFQTFQRWVNAGVTRVERLDGNIGYLEIRGFMDPKAAAGPIRAALDFLANTDALIVDVRRNGGGDPATVRLLCSYLFDEKPVHLNDIYMRQGNRTEQFWTLRHVPGRRYLSRDVYVLCSKRTASGAEEFCYNLQNLKRATLIGETTWGGANPGDMYRLNDHFSAFIPQGRAINPYTKTNWEGTGVQPDVPVAAEKALQTAQVMALKRLLEKAETPEIRQGLTQALRDAETGAGAPPSKG